MNKTILVDHLFTIWNLLPHCILYKKKHLKDIRGRFNYKNLSDISILSTNCIGGEISHLLGLQFASPAINCTFVRRDFIILCEHLKEYMACEPRLEPNGNKGLIMILEPDNFPSVRIGFPHNTDGPELLDSWNRRKARINYDKLVLICDDQGVDEELLRRFEAIPAFRKILFTKDDKSKEHPFCHKLPGYENLKETGDYNGKSLRGLWKFTSMWDYVSFLNKDEH